MSDTRHNSGGVTENTLQRRLKNRHIQMMALGGALGTGLFYGSGEAIAIAGPAVLLSYCIGGIFMYLVLRMLGEMAVQEPAAGSFSYFAYRYWGEFAGFLSGWNYWFMFIVVGVAELTVIGIYLDYWLQIAHWKTAFPLLLIISLLNLSAVRFYGELEFWLSCIKVLAVAGMMIFGIIIIVSGLGNHETAIANLWQYGGFFPHGAGGMMMALAVIMFSFGGSELIGMTAAEAYKPETTLPRAIRQYSIRLLLFYIGATAVILILNPWNAADSGIGSPFVAVFNAMGIHAAADILNIVVIIAAVSVLNSGIYANGRMLFSLAQQKNAPHIFMRLNSRKAPYAAILFSSLCIGICLCLNFLIPGGAFMRVLAIVTTSVSISWAMIVLVHLRFRRAYKKSETKKGSALPLLFKSPCYPFSNYCCIAFLILLFMLMLLSGFGADGILLNWFGLSSPLISVKVPDVSLSALIAPIWILLLYGGFFLKKRYKKAIKV